MKRYSTEFRQAHLPHDFLSETMQDEEEDSCYLSPRSIPLAVSPPSINHSFLQQMSAEPLTNTLYLRLVLGQGNTRVHWTQMTD